MLGIYKFTNSYDVIVSLLMYMGITFLKNFNSVYNLEVSSQSELRFFSV